MNGLTVYFMERSSLFQEEKSSFPLIPTLTTIATLQNVKNTHLGLPYKKCIRESYKPKYSYNTCEYEKIIAGYQVIFLDFILEHENNTFWSSSARAIKVKAQLSIMDIFKFINSSEIFKRKIIV